MTWIRSVDSLEAHVARLRGQRAVALDTESDGLYHYREQVCLLQLADREQGLLVDPLAFSGLEALGALCADPGVVKVLHAADNDIASLKRDFGFTFVNLLDTAVAARFAGHSALGLGTILAAELGITVKKGAQKDDWSARPLRPEQEAYALNDVLHLVALGEHLGRKLAGLGRLRWVQEECEALAALPAAERQRDAESWRATKGASDLGPRQLAVLREVHAWREGLAEAANRPPFKIVQPTTLIALATRLPRDREALARMPEAPRLLRHPDELLAAIERGLALPLEALPRPPRGQRPQISEASARHAAALKALRLEVGARLGLEPALILPQRLIDRLSAALPRSLGELEGIEGLRQWRIEVLGRQLLARGE